MALRFALDTPVAHDSPEWHDRRRKGIGGSDAAAVLGLNPYSGLMRVYLDKLGLTDAGSDDRPAEPARWGQLLEGTVAAEWAARQGSDLALGPAGQALYDAEYPYRRGEPDRLVYVGDELSAGLEVKVTGRPGDWAPEPGDNDPMPVQHIVQCWHYMLITGLDTWHVAALVAGGRGGMRLESRTLHAEPDGMADLAAAEDRFWYEHVLPAQDALRRDPEAGFAIARTFAPDPDEYTRAELRGLPASWEGPVDLDADVTEWLLERRSLVARIDALADERAMLESRIILALAGAEVGVTADGWRVTWKAPRRLDVDRLAREHPEIAAAASVSKVVPGMVRTNAPELYDAYSGPGTPSLRVTEPEGD